MILGVYLIVSGGATAGGSLFWFLLFPPMVMFSAGLRHGSYMFAAFYLFLVVITLTPLKSVMATPLPLPFAARFLLAMLVAFIFAWFAEYMRFHARQALVQTMKRLEQDALTDPLTGLGNRRDFQNYFAWIAAKSTREQRPFSIAMIDVDHFKRVNDKYGHEIGDRVLVHLAGVLTSDMRAMDRLFRWGGEEFLLLTPETAGKEAYMAAGRLRKKVAETIYEYDGIMLPVTVSIGMHTGGGPERLNEQIAEADRKLYMAKMSGRNAVVG